MTTQEFIAKYEGWFSYTRREELKKEMEADLESVFTALRQPPVSGLVADAVGRNCPFCGEPCPECSHKATDR